MAAILSADELAAKMREPDFRDAISHYASWLVENLRPGRYGRYETLIHDGKIDWRDRTYRDRPALI